MIPQTIDFTLSSQIHNGFRTKMACDSVDLDIAKKSTHHVRVDNVILPERWNLGLIYGASGSGKTTIAKHIFGDDIF